ncbi:DUF826 domain-containing protein [Escherichia coli]|nr:DUF826 domain-containing protein [Escherichia coli]EKE5094291.1 DUF826 domain-containing protein [Escherichia coli]
MPEIKGTVTEELVKQALYSEEVNRVLKAQVRKDFDVDDFSIYLLYQLNKSNRSFLSIDCMRKASTTKQEVMRSCIETYGADTAISYWHGPVSVIWK